MRIFLVRRVWVKYEQRLSQKKKYKVERQRRLFVGIRLVRKLKNFVNKLYGRRTETIEFRNKKKMRDGLTLKAMFHHKNLEIVSKKIVTFVLSKWNRDFTFIDAIIRETEKMIKL